jgi:NAD(P)-dependent dehydrogenase (short-subunit alcohol dehydrogenase family)
MRFDGKWALVPGGMGAIGRHVVSAFVREGCRVVIPVRERPVSGEPAFVSTEWGEGVHLRPCDIASDTDVERLRNWLMSQQIGVDFLINAAGGYAGGARIEETTTEEWESMIRSNLDTSFRMTRLVLPTMRTRGGGRLVFIAAAAALRPPSHRAAYVVSKRAVITLMECLVQEVKGTGITVNVIAPGTVLTDANRASMPEADTRSWVHPEEIAATAIFLCTREAQRIQGSVLSMTN